MGQRFMLSFSDIKMANEAYSCHEGCPRNLKCENEGFLDENCKCKCPDEMTGSFCEKVNSKQPTLFKSPKPRLTCTFEIDLCDWLQEETRDSEDWVRNAGFTKTQLNFNKEELNFKTGPQLTENELKHSSYVYLNSFDQTKQ